MRTLLIVFLASMALAACDGFDEIYTSTEEDCEENFVILVECEDAQEGKRNVYSFPLASKAAKVLIP